MYIQLNIDRITAQTQMRTSERVASHHYKGLFMSTFHGFEDHSWLSDVVQKIVLNGHHEQRMVLLLEVA